MMLWQATPASLWQGRDDSAEAPNALRLFQTIVRAERFAPQEMPGDIALLGFACDEGVRRNKGRTGAADGGGARAAGGGGVGRANARGPGGGVGGGRWRGGGAGSGGAA
ncbi:hypothetical protein ACYCI6_25940, partial [Klebsiella pneumoniae]